MALEAESFVRPDGGTRGDGVPACTANSSEQHGFAEEVILTPNPVAIVTGGWAIYP